jgi:peptide/nickel transport system substrate-binding protein
VILTLNNADANCLFRLGENTAVILDPKSAATAATSRWAPARSSWTLGRAARSRW